MIFAISDLHLATSVDKPMDVFGDGWSDFENRLEQNWKKLVGVGDTVVIPGDISWGMTMEEAISDFAFLDKLPGKKLIGKGNHDYWWTSGKKMEEALQKAGITSIEFLHNNAFLSDGIAMCGTKGYMWDTDETKEQNEKLLKREYLRLELSLNAAKKLGGEPVVFLHYPPLTVNHKNNDMINLMLSHGVKRCYYGHIHGPGHRSAYQGDYMGIDFTLISADYLKFNPILIK